MDEKTVELLKNAIASSVNSVIDEEVKAAQEQGYISFLNSPNFIYYVSAKSITRTFSLLEASKDKDSLISWVDAHNSELTDEQINKLSDISSHSR